MKSAINAEFPTMGKFTKLPVTVDAYRLPAAGEDVPDSFHEWAERVGFIDFECDRDEGMLIPTLEGRMRADPGDWIIKGVKGEFYPCKPEIFAATYALAVPADADHFPDARKMVAAAPMSAQPSDEELLDMVPSPSGDRGNWEPSDLLEYARAVLARRMPAATQPPAAPGGQDAALDAHQANGLAWAVHRWESEVKERPMGNVHRRSLDDAWRQVVRYFGGNPDALLGPSHDAAMAAKGRAEGGAA